jgi:hypothetical protein
LSPKDKRFRRTSSPFRNKLSTWDIEVNLLHYSLPKKFFSSYPSEFANVFDGKAEVISEDNKLWSSVLHEATDADILALLSRRPCTLKEFPPV